MLIRRAPRFTASEITEPKLYLSRRELMAGAAALALMPAPSGAATPKGQALAATRNAAFSLTEPPTKIDHATTYNNFYEFGVNKDDPSRLAHTLQPAPVDDPGRRTGPQAQDLRHRRADSPLPAGGARVLAPLRGGVVDGDPVDRVSARVAAQARRADRVRPSSSSSRRCSIPPSSRPRSRDSSGTRRSTGRTSRASGSTRRCIHWRCSRSGCTGRSCPNQNGAPVRMVVPWKYGFKSAKSIVRIRLVSRAAQDVVGEGRAAGVRVLFQRQPGGQPSALEPGRPSGASASSAGGRHCRSTATRTRSPRCTPGWT